jgi:putative FmdB family regulatory protein
MPTYDYKCQACDHEFEKFQPITSSAIRKCPECGKLKVKRLLGTGGGIIFKGSGFYQTDYRSDGYKAAAEKDKPATESKSSDNTSSESKSSQSKSGPTTEKKSADKSSDS